MPSEISQTGEDKYSMILLICGILKNIITTEYNIKEADAQIQRTNLWLPVWGRGIRGVRE